MDPAPRRIHPVLTAGLAAVCVAATALADIAVSVTVDPAAGRTPISSYIYGSNFDVGAPITAMRQGGNRMTGYNWENNASNAGSDWYHNSDNYLTWNAGISGAQENTPGIVVTAFHDEARSLGAAYSIVTLQLAGYVARDKSGEVTAAQVAPSSRWAPVSFTKPTALSTTPDTTDNAVYMDEFVNFLVTRYGSAATSTGVRGYCLDNEPDLWSSTHARIHPNQPRCAELVTLNTEGAKAVKRIDPAAETFGFVSYGFAGYVDYQGAPDWSTERTKGTYRWFVDYYLDQMKRASDTAGTRLLDAIDLHNYSEATGGGSRVNDPSTWTNIDCNKARMQAPRSYWDATYTENSWIGQWFPQFLPLLPNVKASIASFYPGTKLALTEYNFGGESHISGGIAQADTLGIFADQAVYLATWWQLHENPTYIAAAYRLYRSYDGAGATVGDTAIASAVDDSATCSVHASVDAANPTKLHLILLNKSYDQPAAASIQIAGTRRYTSARVYAFDSASPVITERTAVSSIANNSFSYTLPALTAAHLVLQAENLPPVITQQPAAIQAAAGARVSFAVIASGDGALTYQWRKNGAPITSATSSSLTLPAIAAGDAATYSVVVTNAGGTVTSADAALALSGGTYTAPTSAIVNLSTRGEVRTADQVMIAGFVVGGSGAKKVLVRAVGPTLAGFGVSGVLLDPVLTLKRSSDNATLATADDWDSPPAMIALADAVGAFALSAVSKDAVMAVDLPPGSYTAIVEGKAGGTGIALVEVYDCDTASAARLINLSTRGFVGAGDGAMVAGFVVSGSASASLLVRTVGPTLAGAPYNVGGTLADPSLALHSTGTSTVLLDTNNDWGANSASAAQISSAAALVGAFSLSPTSKDAALLTTRPSGTYTATVTDPAGATGVALAEVYLVP